MLWTTVKGAGKSIAFTDVEKGPASIAAPRFLDKFHDKYIKQCYKYFNATEDIPFNYSEMRMHSVMIPALDKVSDAVFVEQYINKKGRAGRVDYLVLSGNQVYLIELKHSWLSFNSGNATVATNKKWQNAFTDLKAVSWEEAFSIFPEVRTVAKVALMVVPLYNRSKNLKKLANQSYTLERIFEKYRSFSDQLSPKPGWMGIWAVKPQMAKPIITKDHYYECYPAVALFACIKGKTK